MDASIEMPALGRPLRLGMLYDRRTESIIPGVTLWDMAKIKEDVRFEKQTKTQCKIIASDSIEDKSSALNISPSLKASFLGGLVEVSGSASYLNETKTSKHQARVTLQYAATTKFEALTMKQLGTQNITYPDVFDKKIATHVVTAVLYGAQAFFVFDREVSSTENMQTIQGSLHAAINMIPLMKIEGETSVKMSNKDKSNFQKFSCTFCGDFALEKNPVTYEDAIEVYSTLSSRLGADGQNTIPVKVWLYPLTKLDSKAAQLVRTVSMELIDDIQAAVEELNDIDMHCNDMLKQPAAEHFPEICSRIQKFADRCKKYKLNFQTNIANILPSIRSGGKEEGELLDILNRKEQSPFSGQQLTTFLESRQQELKFVDSILDMLKEVKVISSISEINQLLLNPAVERVITFSFTSLQEDAPYLLELKQWLISQYDKEAVDPTKAARKPKSKEWYNDMEIIQRTSDCTKTFLEFAKANKSQSNKKMKMYVSSVVDQSDPGALILLYERGSLMGRKFEPPISNAPVIQIIGHDRVQLVSEPSGTGKDEILSCKLEYKCEGEENWTAVEINDDDDQIITVTGLQPNSWYQFRQYAVYRKWVSLPSDPLVTVKTTPTGPPGMFADVSDRPGVIRLTWQQPTIYKAGTTIGEYKLEYKEDAGNTIAWLERRTGQKIESCTFEGLKPDARYRFRVTAIYSNGKSSAPSDENVFPASGPAANLRHIKFTNYPVPFYEPIPSKLCTGSRVTFEGRIPADSAGFVVNLEDGKNNILLHISPRFKAVPKAKYVVPLPHVALNTYQNGEWKAEINSSPMLFQANQEVQLIIDVKEAVFELTVNGKHLCDFKHRRPVNDIRNIRVTGDVKIYFISC